MLFIGLVGVATMLIAGAAIPYETGLAHALFGLGAAAQLGFAVWRTWRTGGL